MKISRCHNDIKISDIFGVHERYRVARIAAGFKKMPISLTTEQYEWLRKKAFEQRVPMSHIIREVLEAVRQEENPQGRLV